VTQRYRLVVAYLGTPYRGWQRQLIGPTVQGTIEAACGRVLGGTAVSVVGSGRTDAGVHAAGQVAHVDLPAAIPPDRLRTALNNTLPDSIRVMRAATVPQSFHARRSARRKRYVYRLRWSDAPVPRPWQVLRTTTVRQTERIEAMRALVDALPGTRDWASFTVADPEVADTTRTLFAARVVTRRHGLELTFVGAGFLRYQVRRLVGGLLQVGWAQHDPGWFHALLETPHAGAAVLTAAARGLTLERVSFDSRNGARR
jgi:tRNA pseudouridine38-40 synthase